MEYKISKIKPDIYNTVIKKFGIKKYTFETGLVFAYYPYIHTYSGKLDPALLAHELTHLKRQENTGPEWWWDKYLNDVEFRLKEELLAYRAQYQYVLKNYKKNSHYFNLKFFAECMADKNIYGFDISVVDAMNKIKE